MSKQTKAKEAQGYIAKVIPSVCGNCANFTSDKEDRHGYYGAWVAETNLRCGIGGFAVKKMGTCKQWKAKEPTA